MRAGVRVADSAAGAAGAAARRPRAHLSIRDGRMFVGRNEISVAVEVQASVRVGVSHVARQAQLLPRHEEAGTDELLRREGCSREAQRWRSCAFARRWGRSAVARTTAHGRFCSSTRAPGGAVRGRHGGGRVRTSEALNAVRVANVDLAVGSPNAENNQ